jgi:tetratricopeptide (TPR) repeat protein/transcriptional regulator with XRE-family HTH domain
MASAHPLTFADLLRHYRRAAGLSQEQLAVCAGLSRRAVSDLEREAQRVPRKDTVALLAEALGLSAQERAQFTGTATHRAPAATAPRIDAVRPNGVRTPLVGRLMEQAQLERHLHREGPPVLLLAGEPGIGKTRLLRMAAERARTQGWCVLEGGCQRRDAQGPYAPLLDAIATWLRGESEAHLRVVLTGCAWLVRLLPELAETSLVPMPQWTLPPEQERRLLFAAVGRFLRNVARTSGTLLVLDDLQWAGTDALDLLTTLLRAEGTSLRVVGAYRSTEVRPGDALSDLVVDLAHEELLTHVPVEVLAPPEATELLSILLESGEHSSVVEQVLQRSGGVPFFLVSCARALRTGTLGDTAADVPWDAAQSIRQRVAALPAMAQQLLGVAAVVGRMAPRSLLASVLNRSADETVTLAEASCAARLLRESDGEDYVFTHDLIREVVEADLSAGRRRLLHHEVGNILETLRLYSDRPEEVAHHFAQAGEPTRALPYALQAGNQAAAVFAYAEAERQYRMALELARGAADHTSEAMALEKLTQSLIRQERRSEEALEVVEQGVRLNESLQDAEAQARLAQIIASIHVGRGTAAEGTARLQALIGHLSAATLSVTGQARLADALAWSLVWKASFALGPTTRTDAMAAFDAAARGLQLAQQAGDTTLRLKLLFTYALALNVLGQSQESLQAYEDLIAIAESAGDVDRLFASLLNAGNMYLCMGQFATCQAYCDRALALTAQYRWLSLAWVHASLGELEYTRGRWVEAQAYFEHGATTTAGVREMTLASAGARIWRGLLMMAQGHEERAAAELEEPLQWVEQHRHLEPLSAAYGMLAERDLLAGRFEEARARLEPLRDPDGMQPSELQSFGPQLAWAHVELGDWALASATIGETRTHLQEVYRSPRSPFLPDVLRVEALIAARTGRRQDAMTAVEEALALCRALPHPYAEAKTLYVMSQFLQAQGADGQARTRLEEALAICDRLGEGMYRPHIVQALATLHT